MPSRFTENYRPLYFLAALGMGGLSVSFFMYLMFLIPHPDSPMPTQSDLIATFRGDSLGLKALTVFALIGIVWFAVRHVQLLVANLKAYSAWSKTEDYQAVRSGNGEVTLMAMPLTLAMSVNVAFILGALAVPGLWNVVEYLFPLALLAFVAVGWLALRIFGRYLVRVFAHRGYNMEDANHFSQLLPAFAFVMVAVGFASPAAMSTNILTATIGMFGAFFFMTAAIAWITVKLPLSFASILRQGMAREAGPTLWIGIPIFTLIGITVFRLGAGISHGMLGTEYPPVIPFVMLGLLFAAQLVMGLLGYAVMRGQGYFEDYVWGDRRSVPAYGLICPGVALAVLGMFFIHWGLVQNDVIAKFSPAHFVLLAGVLALQARTIQTMAALNKKMLTTRPGARPLRDETGKVVGKSGKAVEEAVPATV